jgi:hypothetical protein
VIIPRSTAESSLYKSTRIYSTDGVFKVSEGISNLELQIARGTYGPIGLPGQGCKAACWHLCSLGGSISGPSFEHCLAEECDCVDSPFYRVM